jgi:hypothetical protein
MPDAVQAFLDAADELRALTEAYIARRATLTDQTSRGQCQFAITATRR